MNFNAFPSKFSNTYDNLLWSVVNNMSQSGWGLSSIVCIPLRSAYISINYIASVRVYTRLFYYGTRLNDYALSYDISKISLIRFNKYLLLRMAGIKKLDFMWFVMLLSSMTD